MTQISNEYAESLFSLAVEVSKEEEYLEELRFVLNVFQADPEYVELLSSPALTREERIAAIDESLGERLSEYVMSFLKVLCESGHMKLLPECVDEYAKMYRDAKKRSAVKVTSAAELTDDEKHRILNKVERIVGGECEITFLVDPSLLGGAVIETENAVIDGSLKKSLQEVKEVIKK
jgi:F-type H+-transporting ATPase subunit delta